MTYGKQGGSNVYNVKGKWVIFRDRATCVLK